MGTALREVDAMASALGINPMDPRWKDDGGDDGARQALGALVEAQLEARARARAEKDWSASDAIRDSLAAAGIEIADSAEGASWSLRRG